MIKHRKGDPRETPPLRSAWDDDCEPGAGIGRAIVYSLAALVLALAIWSAL